MGNRLAKGHRSLQNPKKHSGCYSYVGYEAERPQIIGMSEPECMNVGTAAHEMLHAAGLVHEHTRSDRDEYVRLIKENLGGNINNINMRKADTYDLNPYDYESIMQYSLKEGSINRKQTIEFLDKDLEFLAGSSAGEGLDFYDIKDVIVNYQCAG
ncbi:zinc metalloproteinase nas-1-like [Magallana gigas]|uniref:zinc metalloproteinase nas-1-like n=1 Tax=Magallana gigas TaxID=29159 RepID=UPI0033408DAC